MTPSQVSGSMRQRGGLAELRSPLPVSDERDLSDLIQMALQDRASGDVHEDAWKRVDVEELVIRLRGLLHRLEYLTPQRDVLVVGDLELDDASRAVTRAGASISLTSTEFELLHYLMRRQGRAVSRKEILARVWNYDFGGRTGIVDLYVSYLRKKVDAGRAPMIHTVRGVGYLLKSAE
jgi:two-component system response regulator TrcR